MSLVREVTPTEVEHFGEHGWVVLRRFLDADHVRLLGERARAQIGEDASASPRSIFREGITMWRRYDDPWREHPEFGRLSRHHDLGMQLSRLAGGIGLRYLNDQVAVKLPLALDATHDTPWHQDNPYLPIDRLGDLTTWIPLDDLTPEQGTLRFLSGSQAEGPVEATLLTGDLREVRPELWERYEVSEPLHLEVGDATVHHGCIIHSAPVNTTDEARWAYIAEYIPADARVDRLPNDRAARSGLDAGDTFDHPDYPLVSEPVAEDAAAGVSSW